MNNMQERKAAIRQAKMPRSSLARTMADVTSNLVKYAAKAELFREQLSTFIVQLYEVDEAGQLVNVDFIDGKILVKTPWRKTVREDEAATLRTTERTVLRAFLSNAQKRDKPFPLFIFDKPFWYLSIGEYRNAKQALSWLDALTINAATVNTLDTKRRVAKREPKKVSKTGR